MIRKPHWMQPISCEAPEMKKDMAGKITGMISWRISGRFQYLSDAVVRLPRMVTSGSLTAIPPEFSSNFNHLKRIRQPDPLEILYRHLDGHTSYLPVYAPGFTFSGLRLSLQWRAKPGVGQAINYRGFNHENNNHQEPGR